MLRLLILVSIWWISNAITSIASKNEMGDGRNKSGQLTDAFRDMRWVVLTALQFLFGGVVSLAWSKATKRKLTPHLKTENKKKLLIAVLANLIGHLSVNASYTFVSSAATQVIKSCEPIFMFLLLSCLSYRREECVLNIPLFFSLILMALGTCFFVVGDITFDIWGGLLAVLSNLAFPLRNIVLKKMDTCLQDPLEQYLALSVCGSLLLVPVTLAKLIVSGDISLLRSRSSILASAFHYMYNAASITVLKSVSPMNHCILNFIKRIFVIMANINYFNTIMTRQMTAGFVILVTGLSLYHYINKNNNNNNNNNNSNSPQYIKGSLAKKIFMVTKSTSGKLLSLVGVVCVFSASLLFYFQGEFYLPCTTRKVLPERMDKIATSWVYHRPIPQDVVENIKAMHFQCAGAPIHVYCGTTQCTKAIKRLHNQDITTELVAIPDLVKNTSLERWIMRHPLNKILTGIHFEDHLQEAVRLAHHWRHGGVFIDPTVRLNEYPYPRNEQEWLTISPTVPVNSSYIVFEISSFPPRHPFIKKVLDLFERGDENRFTEQTLGKFRETVWNIYRNYCDTNRTCPLAVPAKLTRVVGRDKKGSKNHFGTLSYDTNSRRLRWVNLGDEIQGFPGVQFLPYVDFFLDREKQTVPNREDNFTVFYNAWWSGGTRWPAPPNIHPIMISMHLEPRTERLVNKSKTFFKRHEPVGCRDEPTLHMLKTLGVDSYFSGCLTLLLQDMNSERNPRRGIYIVDVEQQFRELLPSEINKRAISVTHRITRNDIRFTTNVQRFTEAYEHVEIYSRAKLVITQRIHCALPCVAMGTPVIFINSPNMPGGGGSSKKASSRVGGLTNLFHTLDMYNMSMADAKTWLRKFNWNDPPRNPNVRTLIRMRATFWNVIRQNRVFYEVAHKFGMFPLTPRWLLTGHSQLVFHLIFTPSRGTSITKDLSGVFNWRQWRCVESIFHHHPSSKVIIYSNVLQQSTFNVLTEVGYDLKVKGYNLATLARNTPLEMAVKEVMKLGFLDEYFHNHNSVLLRLLLMYKFGGVCLDTDIIIVRPLNELRANVLGLETVEKVMKFEKGHPFLDSCLQRFVAKTRLANTSFIMGNLKALFHEEANKNGVELASKNLFYTFDFNKMQKECFNDTNGAMFEVQMQIVKSVSFVVHLHSELSDARIGKKRLRDGTICKHLLNSYCVLCNMVY